MIKRFNSIYTIYNNTFTYMPIIYFFYKNYDGQDKDMLLSYLILPLILDENSKKSLLHSRSSSSLYTFCRKKENIYGLQERVTAYKELTNNCIQYGVDNKLFLISGTLRLLVKEIESDNNLIIQSDEPKAASKLCNIFKSIDIPTIYRNLGVVKL
jgi:hypothetical protein